MQVTKRSEYAIISALYLAENRGFCDVGEIAKAKNLPASLVAKAFQRLSRAGILGSKRGQGGGYYLARPAHEVSLLDLIEAVEGPVAISDCIKDGSDCTIRDCGLETALRHVQETVYSKLASITLADVVASKNGHSKSPRPIVLCDFDGTISTKDVSDTIFTKWLQGKWREIDRQWHDGKVSMVHLYEKCWSLVDASEAELYAFVDEIEIDPGFDGFVRQCKESEVPIYLVSDGFDFYIRRIMSRYGLSDLTFYSNRLSFTEDGRPVLGFHNQHPDCIQCANCKKFIMDEKRRGADFVIYIGNGLSDRCAAEHADLVFAKDSLLKHCRDNGIACVPYESFTEITEYLTERLRVFGAGKID